MGKTRKNVRAEEREVLFQLIERYLIRNIKSAREIKQHLENSDPPFHLSERSIYRYIKEVRKRNHQEVLDKIGINETVDSMAYTLKKTIDEVLRELWTQYHKPVSLDITCPHCKQEFDMKSRFATNVKVKALLEIERISSDWVKTMQNLGLLYQAPVKNQMVDKDGNPIDPKMDLELKQLNQVFTAFIKAQNQDPIGFTPKKIEEAN